MISSAVLGPGVLMVSNADTFHSSLSVKDRSWLHNERMSTTKWVFETNVRWVYSKDAWPRLWSQGGLPGGSYLWAKKWKMCRCQSEGNREREGIPGRAGSLSKGPATGQIAHRAWWMHAELLNQLFSTSSLNFLRPLGLLKTCNEVDLRAKRCTNRNEQCDEFSRNEHAWVTTAQIKE